MTVLERLGAWVAHCDCTRQPPAVVDRLRLHLLDTLAAAAVGGETPVAAAAAALLRASGARGRSPALGLGVRTTPALAAMAGTAALRCTEIDDIHTASCTTPGSVAVPAALAAATLRPATTPADLLAGLLAGYEVLTRFGVAVDGPAILYRGIWPTLLVGAVGAAATAARVLGLTAEEASHAMSGALAATSGVALPGGDAAFRWLSLGMAAQAGLLAAQAAARGFRADPALLDGAWSRVTGIAVDPDRLTADLDGGSAAAVLRVSVKPCCSAKQCIAAIEAFRRLLAEERLDPAAIERVEVWVPPAYERMIGRAEPPAGRQQTLTSARYQLALAAHHPAELLDTLRPRIHREPAFLALMERVRVAADPALARHYPRAWPARVHVRAAGRELRREVVETEGDPGRPFSWDDETVKVRAVLDPLAAPAAVGRLIDACTGLGRQAGLADLTAALDALAGPTRSSPR